MSQHAQFLSQRHFSALDGLRAISIIAVIWHHTAPSWVGDAMSHFGAHGVSLFFAISGFLITTLLLRERERNNTIDLRAFYVRRTLRIFPLYYGVLFIYILLVSLLERNTPVGRAFYSNLPYFATYTSNLFVELDGRVIFYFAWSLAAEEQFYLLWPSVLARLGSLARAFNVLVLVLLACIVDQLCRTHLLSAIPIAILGGATLALTLHQPQGYGMLIRILGKSWSAPAILLMLALVLSRPQLPTFIAQLLFTALVGACVIRDDYSLKKLLNWKPVAYIGSVSYGMYMLHMLGKNAALKILGALGIASNSLWVFFVTCILAVCAAILSYRYFESYFLRRKVKYER